METLINHNVFADVAITAGEHKFSVLKAILAARSPTLASRFEQEPDTLKTNIEITDMREEVFAEVLFFIYTGRLRAVDGMWDELFYAARKYKLQQMIHLLAGNILSALSPENVIERLLVVQNQQLKGIKITLIKFIRKKLVAVVETEQYKKFIQSKCPLALELLKYILIG